LASPATSRFPWINFWLNRETTGVKFFDGKEPWIEGINKLTWKTFFRVCTEEMDDLSVKATKIVIEYCLEILEEAEEETDQWGKVLEFRGCKPKPPKISVELGFRLLPADASLWSFSKDHLFGRLAAYPLSRSPYLLRQHRADRARGDVG
jgi:hypothetical protein